MVNGVTYEGRLNSDTGNPELWASTDGAIRPQKVASANYHGIVTFPTKVDSSEMILVFGSYWEGEIPLSWIGKAIKAQLIK